MQSCQRDIEGCELRLVTPGQFSQPRIGHLLQSSQPRERNFPVTESIVPEKMIRHLMNGFKHRPCGGCASIFRNLHVNTQKSTFGNCASCERLDLRIEPAANPLMKFVSVNSEGD